MVIVYQGKQCKFSYAAFPDYLLNTNDDLSSGARKQRDINYRLKYPNRYALEKLLEKNDKDHWIHNIRSQILTCEFMNETTESLNKLCLDELFWLFEQLLIKNKYEEAIHKDAERENKSK